ncbi:hypothetical protein PB1_03650 [Bacillus methanolicus PB1]|uniref:Integrase SAM-like N-terminal domain-containing protein n=1 Tax=Bacillus methanolicus PB1 TaxID=997296 RepID=I3E680_BACMT|nr:hypothetical protein [Bacillus methanolicus]EIJ82001.1 hypothetical protein PB1_03650 [Bacillus methanolicus PB1]
MSDTTNLTELIQQATKHLIDLKYSEGTIYRYILVWKQLQIYADTRNYESFSKRKMANRIGNRQEVQNGILMYNGLQ